MIYILSGSIKEAEAYASSINLKRTDVRIINDHYQLRGIRNIHVRLVGTYYRRHDWHKYEAYLHAAGITTEVIEW